MTVRQIQLSHPIAAKPHRCMICDSLISKGESHTRLSFRDDSELLPQRRIKAIRFHNKCPPQDYSGRHF